MGGASVRNSYRSLLRRGRMLPDKAQLALVERLAELQDHVRVAHEPRDAPRGLYIHGGVGTGKTRLVDLFASTLPATTTHRRVHFHDFMLDIHSRLHVARSRTQSYSDALVRIGMNVARESQVLCFDEFQVTDIADAMILRTLFGAIWSEGGVLVSTSNRHPDGLYERGLNRELFTPFISDLKRHCEIWRCEGNEDYRMRSEPTSRRETFFLDSNAFQATLDERLGELGGTASHRIEVAGNRSLQIQAAKAADGRLVINTTFDHLCRADRGASDYIALCRAAQEMYISGLRCFHGSELDLVRRFITLIDIAYERRLRVVCLSQVPLLEVFRNIARPADIPLLRNSTQQTDLQSTSVRREGGSSSSMSSSFIGDMEWSATGLQEASLATGGAGETDVRFAIGRAVSRLHEMGSWAYTTTD